MRSVAPLLKNCYASIQWWKREEKKWFDFFSNTALHAVSDALELDFFFRAGFLLRFFLVKQRCTEYKFEQGHLLNDIVNWSGAGWSVRQTWTVWVTIFLYIIFYKQCWPYMVSIQKIIFGKFSICKKTAILNHFVSLWRSKKNEITYFPTVFLSRPLLNYLELEPYPL